MLTVDTLIRQMELPFSAEDLLYVYAIVQLMREPRSLLPEGNHYLSLKHPNQPQTRLVTVNLDKDLFIDEFVWILGNWELRAGDDISGRSQGVFLLYALKVGLRNSRLHPEWSKDELSVHQPAA